MAEPQLTGGSEQDRQDILRLHDKYIDVNTRFDWEGLTPVELEFVRVAIGVKLLECFGKRLDHLAHSPRVGIN